MNITICDDEKKFADKIKKLCKKILKEQKINVNIFFIKSYSSTNKFYPINSNALS